MENKKKRKLKQPDGWLLEEYIANGAHLFGNGTLAKSQDGSRIADHFGNDGVYTGRFAFQYLDGRITRMYTKKSAPKWLMTYYELATG